MHPTRAERPAPSRIRHRVGPGPARALARGAAVLCLPAILACTRGPDTPASGVIRVGYFPNLTHAQALVGLARGDFARTLEAGAIIEETVFNAGPSVIEAVLAKRIDLAYVGPNPAINGYVQSHGEALRIVAGATSAGAALVVLADAGITSPSDLAGKRLATPQLGNTQDVALRAYLAAHGLRTREKGGDVEVIPTPNPQIIDLIRQKQIHGAWVPEPWASRLVVEAGCAVLVDERELWPQGDFVTAHVIVSKAYLDAHSGVVKRWLDAHVAVTQWLVAHPAEAQSLVNRQIEKLTGKGLSAEVLARSWSAMRPTWDPIAASLVECANAAHAAGFLRENPDLSGIYDLTLLNEVLRGKSLPEVTIPE
jgi:NitT/TauT family transport system substrate-binding protein